MLSEMLAATVLLPASSGIFVEEFGIASCCPAREGIGVLDMLAVEEDDDEG